MKKHCLINLFLLIFMFYFSKRLNGQSVNRIYAQQGDQYMQIRVDVKNWDHTWNFGKPFADVSIWLRNKTNRKYKVNKLVIALHCGGKNGLILVDFTPYLQAPVGVNNIYNKVTGIKYAATCEKTVTSANVFKGFLVEAINIVQQDITLIDEKKISQNFSDKNKDNGRVISNASPTIVEIQSNSNNSITLNQTSVSSNNQNQSLNKPILNTLNGWNEQLFNFSKEYAAYMNDYSYKWNLNLDDNNVKIEILITRKPQGESEDYVHNLESTTFNLNNINYITIYPYEKEENDYQFKYTLVIILKNKIEANWTNTGKTYSIDPRMEQIDKIELQFESEAAAEALKENLLKSIQK